MMCHSDSLFVADVVSAVAALLDSVNLIGNLTALLAAEYVSLISDSIQHFCDVVGVDGVV